MEMIFRGTDMLWVQLVIIFIKMIVTTQLTTGI